MCLMLRFKLLNQLNRRITLSLFCLLNFLGLQAQIAFANNWNATTSVPNVTPAASGSNRLLVYVITFEDDDYTNDVTSVTYGGQSMTQAVQSTTNAGTGSQSRVEIFYLNNAGITAATHNTFIPVFSISNPTTSHGYYTFAVTLSGVNQSTPICSSNTGERLTSSTVSLASGLSVLSNDFLIYATHGGDSRTHTPSAGFTERFDLNGAGGGQSSTVNDDFIATAATINPTSTASGSQNRFVMAMVRIIPAGATCSFALPIELLNFNVSYQQGDLVAEWETASEKNNAYFMVEQSRDGELWTEVALAKSAGDSRDKQLYQVHLAKPFEDLLYFRLKQVDTDGTYSYSGIKTLKLNSPVSDEITLYPNPAQNLVYITGKGLENCNLKIIDLLGRDMSSETKIQRSDTKITIDISSLKLGAYFICAKQQFLKFIKQ